MNNNVVMLSAGSDTELDEPNVCQSVLGLVNAPPTKLPRPACDGVTEVALVPMFMRISDARALPSGVDCEAEFLKAKPKTFDGRPLTAKRVEPSHTKFAKCFMRKRRFVVYTAVLWFEAKDES